MALGRLCFRSALLKIENASVWAPSSLKVPPAGIDPQLVKNVFPKLAQGAALLVHAPFARDEADFQLHAAKVCAKAILDLFSNLFRSR